MNKPITSHNTISELETIPESWKELDTVMSNFDFEIDRKIEEKLKTGNYWSQYAGYDFCGYVWWNRDKWSCEIWQYKSHIDTIHGKTLEAIMETVSEKYGFR